MSEARGISRRRFVAGAVGGAVALGAGLPLSGCGGSERTERKRGSVAVVGAGLAGLTAAYELDRRGWRVTLFEARDRVGGRCRTFRRELDFGQVAEAGGEYIDASHDQVRGYADSFGLELDDLREVEDDRLGAAVYFRGRRRPYEQVADEEVQAEIERFEEQVDRYAAAIDKADPARTGAGLDARSVGDLLDELSLNPDARELIEADLRTEHGVEADDLSLLFHVVLAALGADLAEEDVERFRIRGGSDRLPGAFADRLRPHLELGSPAELVVGRRSRVRVVAGGRHVDVDYCVIAAPLPALRHIELDVPLPRPLRDAIATLQYGDVTKTALQYEKRFWVDDELSGDTVTDLPVGTTWDATVGQEGKAGVLMSYSAGDAGRRFGAKDEDARIRGAAAQVERIYPGSRKRLVAGASVAWREERYSGGAYSAWAPGQYTRFWPALRVPYGRVYFAGEHTDLHATYMEGAVRSGRRVATAIEARGA